MERLTKNGLEITAKDDSRRYYYRKGKLWALADGSHEVPYFAVPSQKYKDPFKVTFGDDCSVTVNPGIVFCYGRFAEVEEETRVIDDITLEYARSSSKVFVYIYLRVDLDDTYGGGARFVIDYKKTKGDSETAFPDRNYHDNLSRLGYGIYDIPIASFLYNPLANSTDSRFTGLAYYIRERDNGQSSQTLLVPSNGKIGNSDSGTIAGALTDGSTFVPSKARNASYANAFGAKKYKMAGAFCTYTRKAISRSELVNGNWETKTIQVPVSIEDGVVAVRLFVSGLSGTGYGEKDSSEGDLFTTFDRVGGLFGCGHTLPLTKTEIEAGSTRILGTRQFKKIGGNKGEYIIHSSGWKKNSNYGETNLWKNPFDGTQAFEANISYLTITPGKNEIRLEKKPMKYPVRMPGSVHYWKLPLLVQSVSSGYLCIQYIRKREG